MKYEKYATECFYACRMKVLGTFCFLAYLSDYLSVAKKLTLVVYYTRGETFTGIFCMCIPCAKTSALTQFLTMGTFTLNFYLLSENSNISHIFQFPRGTA
jgi:hypothetical protein